MDLLDRLEKGSGGTVRLNAASLYRTIAGLVEDGLIEPGDGEEHAGVGAPRKIYGVTPSTYVPARAIARIDPARSIRAL